MLPVDSVVPDRVIAMIVVVLAALAHGWRARPGALSQNWVVAIKLSVIALFVGLAVYAASATGAHTPIAPPAGPFSLAVFAGSLVWISLSYSGFNAAVYVAGEARDAKSTVPRAMLLATLLVTLVYLALNAVFVGLAPQEAVSGRPDVAAAAAGALMGARGEMLVRVVAALALLSSVSSMMMAGPRVFAKMADDGLFPAALRSGREAPSAAIAMQAVLACGVILISDLQGLLSYLGLTLSLSAALTVSCVFVLRRRHGAAAVPVTGSVLLPALYVVATLVLAALTLQRAPEQVIGTLSTVVSGGLVFAWLRRRGRRRGTGAP